MKECPKWHRFLWSFRGEEYERISVNRADAKPRYTKWLKYYYCWCCFSKITVNLLEDKQDDET